MYGLCLNYNDNATNITYCRFDTEGVWGEDRGTIREGARGSGLRVTGQGVWGGGKEVTGRDVSGGGR